jgi:mannose/cellobiose epimerase-like protein (N-acyl-D-glucosamine 2-epimerase family)
MLRRTYTAAFAMMAFPALLAAQSTTPVADAFRDNAKSEGKNLIAAAEQFPADKFGFKPTPAQMSFGEIVMHLSQGNDYLVRRRWLPGCATHLLSAIKRSPISRTQILRSHFPSSVARRCHALRS